MLNNKTRSRMAGSGMPFLQARPRPRISKDGRSCRPAIDIIAPSRGHEEPALPDARQFASRILTAFDDGEASYSLTTTNLPYALASMQLFVSMKEPGVWWSMRRSFAYTSMPSSTWTTARTRAESEGYPVDAKGTAAILVTSPSDLRYHEGGAGNRVSQQLCFLCEVYLPLSHAAFFVT
ncbi:hypothetical protein ARMSODRAFT_169122 [Armillaria solidipes]|uniref:Uncharacterized protein n=1 Tax=Armillaria solidipes TaxID=1076256 RepID=A0A2H3C0D3_9AGAR|nr:hypothetical protein ARMSODRAFT_169122 [Armillaria solidipes]